MRTSEPRDQAPVRPALRRAAILLLVLLLPIAAWTVWDYIEARRMARTVDEIRGRGEPVSAAFVWRRPDGLADASRYYDAGAALVDVTGLEGDDALLRRLDFPGGSETEALMPQLRTWLESNRDAESMLAKATRIERYRPVTDSYLRVNGLIQLAQLADVRTLERIAARDADGAVDAAVQQLTICRRLLGERDAVTVNMLFATAPVGRAVGAIPAILALGLSAEKSAELRTALGALDQDDLLERVILAERAFTLGHNWDADRRRFTDFAPGPPGGPLRRDAAWAMLRPYVMHLTIGEVRLMTTFLEQARQPWPARLDVPGADLAAEPPLTGERYAFSSAGRKQAATSIQRRRAKYTGTLLAVVRSALITLAVDRYRQVHSGMLPSSLPELVPSDAVSGSCRPLQRGPAALQEAAAGLRGLQRRAGPRRQWGEGSRDAVAQTVGSKPAARSAGRPRTDGHTAGLRPPADGRSKMTDYAPRRQRAAAAPARPPNVPTTTAGMSSITGNVKTSPSPPLCAMACMVAGSCQAASRQAAPAAPMRPPSPAVATDESSPAVREPERSDAWNDAISSRATPTAVEMVERV